MSSASGHTPQIAAALAAEFWARGRPWILLAPLGALMLPGLIFSSMAWEHDLSPGDTQTGVTLHFAFYWMTLLFLGSAILPALDNPWQRYQLPASSWLLVGAPMVCAMVTMFLGHALVATVLNALFDAGWPIWGPGLLAACLIAWAQAVIWSTPNSSGLQAAICLVNCVALLFIIGSFAPSRNALTAANGLEQREMAVLAHVNAWHILLFAFAALGCVGVGTFGFDRLRHGAGTDAKRFVDWLAQIQLARKEPRTAFASAASAQFWLEWVQRGYLLPVAVGVIATTAVVIAVFVPLKDPADFVLGFASLTLVPLIVIGMFFGSRSTRGDFGNFGGSLPLSDRQIATAVLKSGTVSLIVSAVVWATLMAAVVWILGQHLETSKLWRMIQPVDSLALVARVVLAALGVWGGVGLVTSLALARPGVLGFAFGLAFCVGLAGMLLSLGFPRESRPAFGQAYSSICLVLCLIAAVATYVASWRRRLFSRPAQLLAIALVLAALDATCFAELPYQWRYLLPALAASALIPIPLAAAPLAVNWNRHR